MHKGINTTVDEGQTPIVTAGGVFSEAVAFKPSHYTRGKDGKPDEVTPPLSADADKGDQDQDTLVMRQSICFNWQNGGGYGNANAGGQIAVAFTKAKRAQSVNDDESWVPGEVAPTQNQFDVGDTRATTVVAFTTEQTPKFKDDCALTMTKQSPSGGGQPQCVATAMAVRRLTPRECERLQGFPDDYTLVEYRKKPAADGPKYRALGNSMAVPCMAWLGYRIHLATHRDTP